MASIRLEPEQVALLSEIVAAHRRVPREQRDRFLVISTHGGSWLQHRALRDWRPIVAVSDVEILAEAGIINSDWNVKGRISGFRVTQHTLDVHDAMTGQDHGQPFPGDTDLDHNDPLTAAEVRLVAERVELVRAHLVSSGVSGQTLEEANRKLDYLVSAADRVGRFDWWNIAVSIVFSIAVSAAFDPAQAQVLFRFIVGETIRLLGS